MYFENKVGAAATAKGLKNMFPARIAHQKGRNKTISMTHMLFNHWSRMLINCLTKGKMTKHWVNELLECSSCILLENRGWIPLTILLPLPI